MTHIAIRCDASMHGGIGHLVRALSVADAARNAGHSVVLAGSFDSPLAESLLLEAALETAPAPEDLGVLAAEQGASVVHVDNYDIGPEARAQVSVSGALLSSMEDSTFGRRPADVVIDSTIHAERVGRPADGSGEVLLGIAYAPMRAQVREARAHRAASPRPLSDRADVLIVMGGTDAMGASATIASVCARAQGIGRIRVISPQQNWAAVRAEAGDGVELITPSPELFEHVCTADLVLSAAGTTAWELACIGVPSLLVAVVDNQVAGYEAALEAGVARGLGTLDQVRQDPATAVRRLEAGLEDLRSGNPWSTGRRTVDGLGAERIVAAWEVALASRLGGDSAEITARPAGPGDSLLLLRWRNDPATRAVSRSTEPVSWESHRSWYYGVLHRSDRCLYVVERAQTAVGTVRFDRLASENEAGFSGAEWEVSITLAPEARGHGLAGDVLASAQRVFLADHPGIVLVASILPDNAPSQRLFRRAGYVLDPNRRDGAFDVFVRRDPR
ncbi:UDP-2,4-diacetamido-2,4,6-trideoxy-beta-L-altropyranose hydrolase [Brachybacterium sp. EF45031]|uniref:bifunctional UDP-2,4-diacetamido-2,4,6-trideoxy-beta-L-altropyranose hydrolase/GNAT family N-acetyltransferase n=1 Tax=Brachybacterium sillae TaxID=2810536 RepID=UPI00217E295E|nr:bifunctional UDP-2,4-diacetamido-2,4,6-trideoxy-beta-L-altropyranose hydrolase/GNAT family N-acetyltransferase [Brachybacterium sillae]MCS6711042.1 UDP-2,4-diacetamido-2,4,6-trideoxy-beta-L-altropyranose hydrolase [Brachybacterium sillae]